MFKNTDLAQRETSEGNSSKELFDLSIFEIDKDKQMVNLTRIAKAFEKDVNQWKRLPSSVAFFNAYSKLCDNYIVQLEGSKGGTWADRKVAIKFAQWISADFEVFCIGKLDELFQTGSTSLTQKDLSRLEILQIALESETKRIEAEARAIKAEEKVSILTHTNKTYTLGEIAKELGLRSAIELNNLLSDNGIQYKQNGTWLLYSKYCNMGLVEIKQEALDNGRILYHRKWTGLGRDFIIDLYNSIFTTKIVA